MTFHFHAIDTATARHLQNGGPDAYGQTIERATSDGDGIPCRHCLALIPAGKSYLILAHRPFEGLNAFTETGPIFLCAEPCERATPGPELPSMLESQHYILRGFDHQERIVYGTGKVIPTDEIQRRAAQLLANPIIAFVHVRSAANNCYHCRIERST